MNELQKSFIDNGSSFLMHYNHNHDKLGRFARSNGTSGSGSSASNDDWDTYSDAKKVFDSLSSKDKKNLTSNGEYSKSSMLVSRKVLKDNAFAEIEHDPDDENIGYISVATSPNARGKGYAKQIASEVISDAERKGLREIYWETTKDNPGSGALARSLGFEKTKSFSDEDDNYVYRINSQYEHRYQNPLEYDKATSELMKERVTRKEQIYQEWKDANRHKYNLDGKLRGPNDEQIVKYHNDLDEFLKNNKEYQRIQKEIAEYESYDVGSNSDKKAEYIKRQNEIYKKRKKK